MAVVTTFSNAISQLENGVPNLFNVSLFLAYLYVDRSLRIYYAILHVKIALLIILMYAYIMQIIIQKAIFYQSTKQWHKTLLNFSIL